MGKKGGIFATWFKHFTTTVFLQSFQAIFLTFSLKMLALIQNTETDFKDSWTTNTDGVLIILTIIVCMSLIKFEKLIKKLLGIEDSFVGDTTSSFGKLVAGAKSAMGIYQTVKKPIAAEREAQLEKSRAARTLKGLGVDTPKSDEADYAKKVAEIETDDQDNKKERIEALRKSDGSKYNLTGYFTGDPNQEEIENREKQANTAEEILRTQAENANRRANTNNNNATAGKIRQANNPAFVDANGNTLIPGKNEQNLDAAGEIRFDREERKKEAIAKAKNDYDTAQHKQNQSKIDALYNLGGSVASLSVGLGATDEISEAVTVANLINQPLDIASTKYAYNKSSKDAFNVTKSAKPIDNRFETKSIQKEINNMAKDAFDNLAAATFSNGHKMNLERTIKSEIKKNIKEINRNNGRGKDRHHNADNIDDT
ncbi:MAG: hypothetical protein RSE41_02770 [Clostridia bacterium]